MTSPASPGGDRGNTGGKPGRDAALAGQGDDPREGRWPPSRGARRARRSRERPRIPSSVSRVGPAAPRARFRPSRGPERRSRADPEDRPRYPGSVCAPRHDLTGVGRIVGGIASMRSSDRNRSNESSTWRSAGVRVGHAVDTRRPRDDRGAGDRAVPRSLREQASGKPQPPPSRTSDAPTSLSPLDRLEARSPPSRTDPGRGGHP